MKDFIALYTNYAKPLELLSDEQLGRLMRALFAYKSDNTIPDDLDKATMMAFSFIRKDIDEAEERRKQRSRINRANVNKRWHGRRKNSTHKESVKPTTPVPCKYESKPAVDYNGILSFWNKGIKDAGSAMPLLSKMTASRRRQIDKRLKEYNGDTSVLKKALEMAFKSPYLNGKGEKGWVADFDWIISEAKFAKVLEGRYSLLNKTKAPVVVASIIPDDTNAEPQISPKERQKNNIMAAINAAKRDPHCMQAQVAYQAYKNGMLRQLGIEWAPDPKFINSLKLIV